MIGGGGDLNDGFDHSSPSISAGGRNQDRKPESGQQDAAPFCEARFQSRTTPKRLSHNHDGRKSF